MIDIPKRRCLAWSLPVVLSGFLLAGCAEEEVAVTEDTARPVKTMLVSPPDAGGIRNFPARIGALNKAEMAFRVPGTIENLAVKEGDLVEAGQLLLALDPTDYEIAVQDAQALFDRADSDFERAKQLIVGGYISQSDYDLKEAQWKTTRVALDKANQDLDYTKLSAPFPGTIAERYVQQYEEVQAKQPVLAIQDNTQLEVQIDVPESVVVRVQPATAGASQSGHLPVYASFDSHPGERFDLTVREIATRADPVTQTFKITFTMPAPEGFLVFPGMTATVTADLSKLGPEDQNLFLPAVAVTADKELDPFVWVVEEPAMTVRKVPVEVGPLSGHSIEILEGLEAGSRVVIAGVGYLADGMAVRLMKPREEAEPRASEAPAAVSESSTEQPES